MLTCSYSFCYKVLGIVMSIKHLMARPIIGDQFPYIQALLLSLLRFLSVNIISIRVISFLCRFIFLPTPTIIWLTYLISTCDLLLPLQAILVFSIIYDNLFGVGPDPAFGIISLFMKPSKSGLNHLSDSTCFHCSPIVPYLKQFLIHSNHLVHSSSLSTFL